MKTVAFYNICEDLNKNNYMFEHANVAVGDDLLLPLVRLKEKGAAEGIRIATVEAPGIDQADAYFFMDYPGQDNKYFQAARNSGKPLFLIVCETPLVKQENHLRQYHGDFRKVFTWNDDLVDGNKYLKLNYAFDLPQSINTGLRKEKLGTLIATNHYSNHPAGLYGERLKAIKWFTRHHPDEFDFYGHGWDKYTFRGRSLPARALNRLPWLRKLLAPRIKTYRGSVERKRPVLAKYKFAICYENYRDANGYITEKIFDCLLAGCVPVYLGARNIAEHIPAACFIDKRKYGSYESLYEYLKGMSDGEYAAYLNNINDYLSSGRSREFAADTYAETLLGEMRRLP